VSLLINVLPLPGETMLKYLVLCEYTINIRIMDLLNIICFHRYFLPSSILTVSIRHNEKHNRSGMVAVLGPFEALPYYIHTYIATTKLMQFRRKLLKTVLRGLRYVNMSYSVTVFSQFIHQTAASFIIAGEYTKTCSDSHKS
jgi:hypothetical protein